MRIMLIDDSKTMRSIERSILNQFGYTELEEACDGLDALNKLASFKPDLILVDWNMPNMNGLSFVEAVRKQGLDTPMIMVASEAEKTQVLDAIKAGVNNYVVKPFTSDQLGSRVKETFAKAAA